MEKIGQPIIHREPQQLGALMQAIKSAEICVLYQTSDLIYQWAENLPAALKEKWYAQCRDSDIFDIEHADQMETMKLQVLVTGHPQSMEMRIETPNQPVWYRFSVDGYRNSNNEIIGLITTAIDISELKRREQVLKVLLREVSHRSKNLLAIIQSIATQTARHSETISSFLKKFQGRIQSLSSSQDLVTDSNWSGAGLYELVTSQVENYLNTENTRLKIEGKNPYLFPNGALHIGLAIHELMINSLAYGALSKPDGTITIDCEIHNGDSDDATLIVRWNEKFQTVPDNNSTLNACFGSAVLQKIVPTSVNGHAAYHINSDSVTYCLTMPKSQFDF